VVNANFGCGSSREHAPQGLLRWGIRALVGVSFAEIFFGNCVALGVPCVTLPAGDVEKLQSSIEQSPETQVAVDLEAKAVTYREPSGTTGAFPAEVPEGAREAFLNGTWDATGTLLARPQDIHEVAAKLPYVNGFAR
jgi:3-isopropylmalate/(R)-2-methylmalate dehydratase small subunit